LIDKTEIEKFINALKASEIKAKLEQVVSEKKLVDENYKMPPKEKKSISETFNEKYEVVNWIDNILNVDLSAINSFVPNDKQIELFEFLSLPFSYKTTLKEDFDNNLLRLKEHLEQYSAEKFIEWQLKIKPFNSDLIPLYLFFKESIDEAKDKNITSLKFIENKVSDLAKGATYGTMISHASKFSHPAATYPRLYVLKPLAEDGVIRTGNAEVEFDLHIDAAKLRVFRFLSLMINGKTIKEHLLVESETSVLSLFCMDKKIIERWQENFHECLHSQNETTNQLIKQVYFPVKDDYHLLSIVFPSSLAFELKKRIETIKYSDESIIARRDEKNKAFNEQGYSTIPNITLYRHGGDHPKNISALNNKYQDVYLLDSCPPQLKALNKNLPKKDFFKSSLWRKSFLTELRGLHRLLRAEDAAVPKLRTELLDKYLQTNLEFETTLIKRSKAAIDEGIQPHHLKVLFNIIIESILHRIIEKIWIIRTEEQGWTSEKQFKGLSKKQKILLDQRYAKERLETEDWFNDFKDKCTNWIIDSYKEELADKQLPLSKEHKKRMEKVIVANKGGLL